jgi:hypothetical protein
VKSLNGRALALREVLGVPLACQAVQFHEPALVLDPEFNPGESE